MAAKCGATWIGWSTADKVAFDLTAHENLQAALLGVFDSQIAGGKRYDLATMGRRRANATYFESHGIDATQGLSFGMDLTPLIQDDQLDIRVIFRTTSPAFRGMLSTAWSDQALLLDSESAPWQDTAQSKNPFHWARSWSDHKGGGRR